MGQDGLTPHLFFSEFDPTLDGMNRQPRPLVRQARRQRAQGLEREERIWQLYASGKRQVAIAAELKLSEGRVSRRLHRRLEKIEEGAQHSPEDLAMMRERLAGLLWSTVESTFETDEYEPTPAMLIVRLKGLDSLAKLYGIYPKPMPKQQRHESAPRATPAEIATAVRERIQAWSGG